MALQALESLPTRQINGPNALSLIRKRIHDIYHLQHWQTAADTSLGSLFQALAKHQCLPVCPNHIPVLREYSVNQNIALDGTISRAHLGEFGKLSRKDTLTKTVADNTMLES